MNRNRLRLIDALRTLDTLPPEPKFRWDFGVTYNQVYVALLVALLELLSF